LFGSDLGFPEKNGKKQRVFFFGRNRPNVGLCAKQRACSKLATIPKQESRAVLFGLKFADNIHYKFKSSQASTAMLQSSEHTGAKTEFNAKWPFKVIQGHEFLSQ